jgi:hypothetical protein
LGFSEVKSRKTKLFIEGKFPGKTSGMRHFHSSPPPSHDSIKLRGGSGQLTATPGRAQGKTPQELGGKARSPCEAIMPSN